MALRDQWKSAREDQLFLVATLQATLHNAHFTRDDKKPWVPSMFMPGYKEQPKPQQSWQTQKAMAQAITKQITEQEREIMAEDAKVMAARVSRAREAQAAGHTPEYVRAIMEGK